jgi:uncharacterized damage-inducible protein DinB
MTYYGAKNLAESFRTVRKNTLAIAEEIPEDQYGFKVTPEVMSVGEVLAHLAISPMWQIALHGSKIDKVDFAFFAARLATAKMEEQALVTKADIVRTLEDHGETFAAFLDGLDEAALQETVAFPPPVQPSTKSRFEMLLGPKEHEMHHRGQLMLVQRMIGQVPHLTRARQQMQQQAQAGAGR